ncbi:MAG: YaiI/YqxD family protein [Acidaminococcaceae bacterium]
MRIIIDADACPKQVLKICQNAAAKYQLEVYTISGFDHNIDNLNHLSVDSNSQEADLKIFNMAKPGDLVITQDWGLAALIVSKNAYCLNPTGIEYTSGKMDFLLEEREVKAKLRRGGGRTKGPKKRSSADDKRFLEMLESILKR